MTARVGLVVRADGSGCRWAEYDGAGRVVGPGEPIRLSESVPLAVKSRPTTAASIDTKAEAASLLAKVRRFLAEQAEPEDPQDRLDRLAEAWAADHGGTLADGYRAVAREHPDAWEEARQAAYLDERPRGY